jgi:hypothetical protein
MNLKFAFASLAVALSASPLLQATPPLDPPIPGKVATVTFALVITKYTSSTKTFPNTGTPTKSIYTATTIKAKYGNKELISDLITKTTLTGGVNDWSLKYVEISTAEFSGLFAVNKNGSVIYLGDDVFSSDLTGGYGYTATDTTTVNLVGNQPTLLTQSGSYQQIDKVDVTLKPLTGVEVVSAGFHTHGESYKYVQQKPSDVVTTNTYSLKPASYYSLVGSNINSPENGMVSGSISISAGKDTANVRAYYNALP